MRSTLAQSNDRILLALIFLAPVLGAVLDPKAWTLWAFSGCLGAALLWFRMRMPTQQRTGKRIWVAWGMGVGYGLLLSYMLATERTNSASLLVAFSLWLLLFLGARMAEERAMWFLALGVAYGAAVAIIASFHPHPYASVLGAGFALTQVLFVLHLSHSHYQAHRNQQGGRQWNRQELRWMVPVLGIGLAISLPAAWIAKTLDWESELPSIGNLPAISTSKAPVLSATFLEEVPTAPYWEHPNTYVLPTLDGQWIGLWDNDNQIPAETAQVLENKRVLATHRVGDSEQIYTYLQQTSKSDMRFRLNGAARSDTLSEGRIVLTKAWKRYSDQILMGFDPQLDALYLSVPGDTTKVPTRVDLEGAKARMPRTWAMIQAWKAEGLSDQEFVDRTLAYFKQHLAYHFDHQSMLPEHNQLDWFLFEDKKGVCRHFSNAFALIMRMGGIRSRIVGGFHGGALSDDGKTWVARARDAHAWTEIWMDGQGWVLVDPTSVVRVEKGVPEGPQFPWNKQESSRSLLRWDGLFQTAGQAQAEANQAPKWLETIGQRMTAAGMDGSKLQDHRWIFLAGPALVLALAALAWWQGRRNTPLPAPEREWQRLLSALYRLGANEAPHQGPRSVAKRLAIDWPANRRNEWMATVEAFERWKFAGHPSPDLARQLRQWRKLARREFRSPRAQGTK